MKSVERVGRVTWIGIIGDDRFPSVAIRAPLRVPTSMLLARPSKTNVLRAALLACCTGTALPAATAPAKAQVAPIKQTAPTNLGGRSLADVESERRALFELLLNEPSNLDASFRYAALSVRVGDLEAAIQTLERMLLYAPNLPRLQLELGLLYHRLGANETAKQYLTAGASGPNVPPAVRDRVDAILARIDNVEKRDRFRAEARIGLRYQSNANRGSADGTILLNGLPFLLDDQARETDDVDAFVAGSFHYIYDLAAQGVTFEVDARGEARKHFDLDVFDTVQGEITFGPAFDLGAFNIDKAQLGLYGIANAVVLDDELFAYAGGAGLRFVQQAKPFFNYTLRAEYRYTDFQNTDAAPLGDLRTGNDWRFIAGTNTILNPRLALGVGGHYKRMETRVDFLDYHEAGFTIGPRFLLDSPLPKQANGEAAPAWTLSLQAGAVWRNFDGPDANINVNDAQRDREWFVGAALAAPFNRHWGMRVEAEYRDVHSNYGTRDHDNATVSIALQRFW